MKPVEFRSTSILIPVLLLAFAACDSDPVATDTEQSELVVAFASLANTPQTRMGTGEHVVDCPAGGRIVMDGEQTHTSNGVGSIITWNLSATYEGCTLNRSGGTAIADGQMQSAGEVRLGEPVNGVAPVAYHVGTQSGSLMTTFDGMSQTCAYDLVHTFEVDDNRYRITGMACGSQLNLTLPAQP